MITQNNPYFLYVTRDGKLFVTDFEGVLICQNFLCQNKLRKDDKRLTYSSKDGQIQIDPLKDSSHDRNYQFTSESKKPLQIAVRMSIDEPSLLDAVKIRREELDRSWEEYFGITRPIIPYTSGNVTVPEELRKETDAKMETFLKKRTRKLIDILFKL